MGFRRQRRLRKKSHWILELKRVLWRFPIHLSACCEPIALAVGGLGDQSCRPSAERTSSMTSVVARRGHRKSRPSSATSTGSTDGLHGSFHWQPFHRVLLLYVEDLPYPGQDFSNIRVSAALIHISKNHKGRKLSSLCERSTRGAPSFACREKAPSEGRAFRGDEKSVVDATSLLTKPHWHSLSSRPLSLEPQISSIAHLASGDSILSSHHTSAIHSVSAKDGSII